MNSLSNINIANPILLKNFQNSEMTDDPGALVNVS